MLFRAIKESCSFTFHSISRYSTIRKPLFDKILIANRGEISCRIIRTAKKLGIKTVAVYSEADVNSLYVQMADEAYLLGPPPSSESYLQMDKIIQIAKDASAQAIHPGYGFLSENSEFARKVTENGITFIGPPVQAIIDMGSKSASKNIMEIANVPVVPGYHGENQDPKHLEEQAKKMGFPVLIKAIKGGGGKGMRIVEKQEEFQEMLQSSKREAIKSFGDDNVLVEKYITRPRHIEVQVFADKLGDAVYLFERDCSVQRRHQKVLEEAPAPEISEQLRKDLGTKAVAAAKAVNYVGAGTVEFIFDTDTGKYYFMEMNTRLQVEHPVTEMVTLTDLVEWQLEVAAGNPLPKKQEDLYLDGHAFEARIYAENPANNFLPDVGPLLHLSFPQASEAVRVETGVRQGDAVSVYYDPMISKLVVKGKDRNEALRVLRKALGEFEVVGLNTNIEFLKKLASHPAFIDAKVDTGFIKKHYDDLFLEPKSPDNLIIGIAALSVIDRDSMTWHPPTTSPWDFLEGFRLNHNSVKTIELGYKDLKFLVDIEFTEDDSFKVSINDNSKKTLETFENVKITKNNDMVQLKAIMGGQNIVSNVVHVNDKIHVFYKGTKIIFKQPQPSFLVDETSKDAAHSIMTPMPCKISQVNVTVGQRVIKGQSLLILEAMKMEHVIRSPVDGIIKQVNFTVNEMVAEGKALVMFEHEESK